MDTKTGAIISGTDEQIEQIERDLGRKLVPVPNRHERRAAAARARSKTKKHKNRRAGQ